MSGFPTGLPPPVGRMRKPTPAGQVGVKQANVSERHSNARDSVTHYRSTAHWQRLRLKILHRDRYTCQICGVMLRSGRADRTVTVLRPAVVDHIAPYDWAGVPRDAATAPGNLWSVCSDCDGQVIRSIEDAHRDRNDWQAVRRDKLAFKVIGFDGRSQGPVSRPIDSMRYPNEQ